MGWGRGVELDWGHSVSWKEEFQGWVVEVVVAEKCEYTQCHLAVCLKMVLTINVMPVYPLITRITAKWRMILDSSLSMLVCL